MKIQIETRLLKAALQVAPKADVRYYLNAVQLEVREQHITAVATDGHILFAGRINRPDVDSNGPVPETSCNVLIPREAVDAALKGYKGDTIELECNATNGQHRLGQTLFNEVDGKFPNWRKVIPEDKEITGKPAQYDPRILMQSHKALAAWSEKTPANFAGPHLHMAGEKAAIAQCKLDEYKDAFCVVMPRRSEHTPSIDWARA